MNRVGQMIYELRTKSKLSAKDLAKKCGLTENYILQVEAGRKIAPESIVEKITSLLGGQFESIDPNLLTKAEDLKAAVPQAPVVPKTVSEKPTETVALSGQWKDALAGVIRSYPVMRGQQKIEERSLVIANKKIEGVHPDFIEMRVAQERIDAFRIQEGDLLVLSNEKDLINDKIYLINYFNKPLIRRLRKEQGGMLTVSPGLSGGSAEKVSEDQIKRVGRVLRVEFIPK